MPRSHAHMKLSEKERISSQLFPVLTRGPRHGESKVHHYGAQNQKSDRCKTHFKNCCKLYPNHSQMILPWKCEPAVGTSREVGATYFPFWRASRWWSAPPSASNKLQILFGIHLYMVSALSTPLFATDRRIGAAHWYSHDGKWLRMDTSHYEYLFPTEIPVRQPLNSQCWLLELTFECMLLEATLQCCELLLTWIVWDWWSPGFCPKVWLVMVLTFSPSPNFPWCVAIEAASPERSWDP